MKAISIRQPWADLIISGQKKLELRSWTVSHRGPLAIHASQAVDEDACMEFGIDPGSVSVGVILGVVELESIQELDVASFESFRAQHKSSAAFEAPLFGWKVKNPQAFDDPVPWRGRMGLFNVPDYFSTGELDSPQNVLLSREGQIMPDSRLPFELQVVAETGTSISAASYRLALFQRPVVPPAKQPDLAQVAPLPRLLVCDLGGIALRSVADAILEALRKNEYAATDLGINRREPFYLSEESGVRLALIFLAVRPIRKASRIEKISRGIRSMTAEELYYWFAKCTTNGSADRAQRALRLLLAEE